MIKRLFLLIALALMSSGAYATDLLVEPYLGYHFSKFNFSGGNTPDGKGMTFGGRLGADYMGLQFGVDYMSGSWTDDQSPADNITPSNFGVFLGYKFPMMLRVYGTYFFDEQYKFATSGSDRTYDGTEFRFGVGLTNLPVININFEFGTGTLTKVNGNSMNAASLNYYGIVISAPFEF